MKKALVEKAASGDETGIFTILLVEDNPDSVKDQMELAEEYVKKKGFKLNKIIRESETEVGKALKDFVIDIVVTDKNLDSDKGGLVVIEAVEKRGHLTDILFYSSDEYDVKDIRDKTDYGYVDMLQGRSFAPHLKKMIDKNLRRSSDIVVLRGILISKVIDIELRINDVLVDYFKIPDKPTGNKDKFHAFVLENRYSSLEGKIKTLSKILEDDRFESDTNLEGLKTKLSTLQENRNLLAHCKRHPEKPGCLITMGEEEVFNRGRVLKLFEKARQVSDALDYLKSQVAV